MFKCVVFDFDGTLVKSNEIKRQTFYEVTKNYSGANLVLDKLLSNPELGDRYKIFDTLISEANLEIRFGATSSFLSNLYTRICESKIIKAPEITGAYNALVNLNKLNVKCFLSSATPKKTLQKIVNMKGWTDLFDEVFGNPQSKEMHIRKILYSNKYTLSEIAYVGDSEADQKAASLVGCKFIGIGLNYDRFNNKPEILLSNLKNFEKVFKYD